jgi:methylated-DNA-[protein]-cysteine S-methyltransferase
MVISSFKPSRFTRFHPIKKAPSSRTRHGYSDRNAADVSTPVRFCSIYDDDDNPREKQNKQGLDLLLLRLADNDDKTARTVRKQITPFQMSVYQALCEVPRGKVTTYQSLAAAVGCKSSQAVGQALRRNPLAPAVPCHRVVKTTRSIGGFGGHVVGSKINDKIHLLTGEGVSFDSEGKVNTTSMFHFDLN